MAEESTKKKGLLPTAVLAGSALAFSSFAVGVPAAFADQDNSRVVTTAEVDPAATEGAEDTTEAPAEDTVETETGEEDLDGQEDAVDDAASESADDADAEATDDASPAEESASADEPEATPSENTEDVDVFQEDTDDAMPSLTPERTVVAPGESVSITATGFQTDEPVNVYLHGEDETAEETPVVAEATADQDGSITASVQIPQDAAEGQLRVTAVGQQLGATPNATLQVTADGEFETNPAVDLAPREAQVGDEVFFNGTGFYPGSSVDVRMTLNDVEIDLGSYDIDGSGEIVDGFFDVPAEAEPGMYMLWFVDEAHDIEFQTNVTVLDDQGQQARTITHPGAGAAGSTVKLQGSNFTPDGDVEVSLVPAGEGDVIDLGTLTADDNGWVESDITIPEDAAEGDYTIEAHDVEYDTVVSGDFVVINATMTATPEELTFEEFAGDPADGAGVTHTVEGLASNTTIEYSVGTAQSPTDLGGTAETDADGNAEFVVAADADADPFSGDFTTSVRYADGDAMLVSASFTILEDVVTEPTLSADREQILLEDFVGDPDEDEDIGVHFTAEGVEANTQLTYTVISPGNVEGLEGTATTNDDGVGSFYIYGYDWVTDPSSYLGEYSVTVSYEDEAGETHEVGPVEFTVVEEIVEERPEVDLSETAVYPGEELTVAGSGFTSGEEFEVRINPLLDTVTTDDSGAFSATVTIPEDTEPGEHDVVVSNEALDESAQQSITVLDPADQIVDPTMTIDPEQISLDDFIGEPEDGAGVLHQVDGLEAGDVISYRITGPENVSDFESTATADDDGVAEFVIHGLDVSNPAVYLGQYTSVVTYTDANGDDATLEGGFTVGDGSTGGSGDTGDGTGDDAAPVDLNGSDRLAQTGTSATQLGLMAGGLLLLAGSAFLVFANRNRLFGRKAA